MGDGGELGWGFAEGLAGEADAVLGEIVQGGYAGGAAELAGEMLAGAVEAAGEGGDVEAGVGRVDVDEADGALGEGGGGDAGAGEDGEHLHHQSVELAGDEVAVAEVSVAGGFDERTEGALDGAVRAEIQDAAVGGVEAFHPALGDVALHGDVEQLVLAGLPAVVPGAGDEIDERAAGGEESFWLDMALVEARAGEGELEDDVGRVGAAGAVEEVARVGADFVTRAGVPEQRLAGAGVGGRGNGVGAFGQGEAPGDGSHLYYCFLIRSTAWGEIAGKLGHRRSILHDRTTAMAETKIEGHAAHSKPADSQEGLKGKITRPLNITFFGAGSGFCPTLCKDVLLTPGADRGEFRLVDVDKDRLNTMVQVVGKLIADTGRSEGWRVRGSVNRREVIAGTHYAVCCVEVSGLACVHLDNDIPLKYGLDQCIGDTLGPGGLFKGLRTIPVFLDILRDLRELAPGAIMLNYTNPMSMLVLAAGRAVPEVPVVGLCHSVQGSSHQLAGYAGVPYEEIEWDCAGVNHLAWFTKFKHNGESLYDTVLYEKFRRETDEGVKEAEAGVGIHKTDEKWHWSEKAEAKYKYTDLVRKDMCVQFGAYITESSGHLSEYLPYYRKNEEGRKLLRLGYDGGSRFYANNWPDWRKRADEHRNKLVKGEEKIELNRSWEYASWIIEAREKDAPYRIHGNIMNNAERPGHRGSGEGGKLITNLPGDGAVEVACMIDRNGVNPTRYGALPAQMAAICRSQMAYFDLAATATIERSVEAAVHALFLDPLTQALLSPREIRKMTLEMFEAEREFLPGYK